MLGAYVPDFTVSPPVHLSDLVKNGLPFLEVSSVNLTIVFAGNLNFGLNYDKSETVEITKPSSATVLLPGKGS